MESSWEWQAMHDTHQTSPIQNSDLSPLKAPVSHYTPPAPRLASQAWFSPVLAARYLSESSDMSEAWAHPVILTMLSGCSGVPVCLQSTPGDHSLSGGLAALPRHSAPSHQCTLSLTQRLTQRLWGDRRHSQWSPGSLSQELGSCY